MLAGAALAAHFGTFIPSLQYTSVASASALVCSQAVWAGLLGRLLGERLPGRAWVGTAICLVGVLLVTGVDVSLSARALGGDVLALVAGVFGGVYIVTGGFVRRDTSTLAYTQLCYGACGLLLLAACLIADRPLAGYSAADWLADRGVDGVRPAHRATRSSTSCCARSARRSSRSPTLFTVPLAALIAALALGQTPPIAAVPALALLSPGPPS